jgi:hypothetical protein
MRMRSPPTPWRNCREYGNGRDNSPLLISIFGRIYDVSAGEKFYGPTGAYSTLSGTRHLPMLSALDVGVCGGGCPTQRQPKI